MEETKLCERSITLGTIGGEESGLLIVTAVIVKEKTDGGHYPVGYSPEHGSVKEVKTFKIDQFEQSCNITEEAARLILQFLQYELELDQD